MANQAYHSGINSKLYAGPVTASVEQALISWSVNENVEIVPFRTSKTGKLTQKEQTFLDISGSFTIEWDFAANPMLTANGGLSITTGGTIAVKKYLNGLAGAYWDIPSCIIQSFSMSSAVEGKIQTSVNWTGNGTWTEPAT